MTKKAAKSNKSKAPVKNEDAFKKYVTDLALTLRFLFFKNLYHVGFEWCLYSYCEPGRENDDLNYTAMAVTVDDEYLKIHIKVYRTAYEAWLKDDFDAMLVHEWCHTLTSPLYRYMLPSLPDCMKEHARIMMEAQTETITRLLMAKGDKAVSSHVRDE